MYPSSNIADCGANAHKHCKDLVVMECRRHTALHGRPSHGMNGSPPNPYQGNGIPADFSCKFA